MKNISSDIRSVFIISDAFSLIAGRENIKIFDSKNMRMLGGSFYELIELNYQAVGTYFA